MVPDRADLLREYLASACRIAVRLSASLDRLAALFPIGIERMDGLTDDEMEHLDAFLHRFASLAAVVQDHVGRVVLAIEEENIAEASRKDQRLLLEKLGAIRPELAFDAIARLRNRLVHTYPDDPHRQADVLNEVYVRSSDLLAGLDDLLDYAERKLGVRRDSPRVWNGS